MALGSLARLDSSLARVLRFNVDVATALGSLPRATASHSHADRERVLQNQTFWSSRLASYDSSWANPPTLSSVPLDKWGYYAWDATWLVARAAASVANTECLHNGTCLQQVIRGYELDGATGNISLGADSGERIGVRGLSARF